MKLSHFIKGNRITLLHNGAEYFPALESAIDAASQEIHLQTYIFKYDLTGISIANALKRAAQRGVAVHLLIDGYGSLDFPEKAIQSLLAAGVQVLHYRQEVFTFRFRRYRLRRLHRKLAVIDARIAFVGGINIINDHQKPGEPLPRFDYAVKIEGPLLTTIHSTAKRLWMLVAWAHFKKRWTTHLELQPTTKSVGNQRAAFVIRDNLRHRRDIERTYLKAISTACNEIIIANAYFLPGRNFRRALIYAARRGVSVILLLQGKIEYRIQYYATRALYGNLLDAGIKIYEYQKSFLHAKVAVIDHYWSTVGSSNIDPLSLLMAREANVIILDQAFAMELRTSLQQAMEDSNPVSKIYWGKQSWINRSLNWISYYIVRILQGMLGYGQERTRV
ncbi:cardiolipin synthase ClsB [Nitrosomonas sp. Nm33]|uniref:cardiolipin synthase ClsB n=1 Tax=Nitrosomonas sp. Nm33 TaxID=133724 RepID=UPI00089D9A01|nr:cardiolipin synthase ClsB [Nitrosomonas sp. Nm33]SDY09503.1 cardiolipin synthase [Nitrosomonas sp. Nm33]